MKIYQLTIFTLALITTFFSSFSSIKAEELPIESITIDFPISRDGFIKSYFAPAFDWNGGYISIGNDGSVYKDGLTRGLFLYELSPIRELGINSENLLKAELVTTFYRANSNTPRPFPIRIDPYDHTLPSKPVYWPERKESPLTSRTDMKVTSGEKYIVITNILNEQLENDKQLDGVQISAEIENTVGIFLYSNDCTKYDLFYNPECTPGMEPYLRIQYKQEKPTPAIIKTNDGFFTILDRVEIQWESEKRQFYEVQISRNQEFSEIESSSPRSEQLAYQLQPLEYGVYYIRLLSYLTETSEEYAISGYIQLEFFDLASFIPEISEHAETISISSPNDSLLVNWEISPSQQFMHIKELLQSSSELDLKKLCSDPVNRFIRGYLKSLEGNRSQYTDVLTLDCHTLPISSQPSPPHTDPDFPFIKIPNEKIAILPEKALENGPILSDEIKTEDVKGVDITNNSANYTHSSWQNPNKQKVSTIKCMILTDLKNMTINKKCSELDNPLKQAFLLRDKGSTFLKLIYDLPKTIELETIRTYCQNTILKRLMPLCPNLKTKIQASYAFQLKINGKSVTPISQINSINNETKTVEFTIASAEKVHIKKIEAEIFLKGQEFGLISLGSYKNNVDLMTQDEKIVQKPFIYPFSKNIGVTQWHGKTFFSDHTGIDFGSVNEEIRAIGEGEVIATGYDTYLGKCHSGGYYVNIKHTNGHHSVYMHLKEGSLKYKTGDKVNKGQIIATSGNSGAYNCQPLGYHLHMETREKREQTSHYDPVTTIEHDWNKILTLGVTTYPGRLTGDNPHPTY